MARPSYSDLLKDPRWQRRRLEILSGANFRCESCEASDKTLHVHHKLYRKGAMPWEYEDHELQSLCEDCHEAEHALRAQLADAMARMPIYDLERLLGYAQGMLLFSGDYLPTKIGSYEHAEGISDAVSSHPPEEVYELIKVADDNDGIISGLDVAEFYTLRRNRRAAK